jgi:hypothetical protein
MEEMRKLIGRREGGGGTPRRPQSVILNNSAGPSYGNSSSTSGSQEWTKQLEDLVSEAENDVSRAANSHELLERDLEHVTTRLQEVSRREHAYELNANRCDSLSLHCSSIEVTWNFAMFAGSVSS